MFDKGSAALANTVELQEAAVGWISALPWNQAPVAFRERGVEQLPLCSSAQPGVRAVAEKLLVHGQEYLCVLKYSASFAGEQLHSLTTSLSKVLQALPLFHTRTEAVSPADSTETMISDPGREYLQALSNNCARASHNNSRSRDSRGTLRALRLWRRTGNHVE